MACPLMAYVNTMFHENRSNGSNVKLGEYTQHGDSRILLIYCPGRNSNKKCILPVPVVRSAAASLCRSDKVKFSGNDRQKQSLMVVSGGPYRLTARRDVPH